MAERLHITPIGDDGMKNVSNAVCVWHTAPYVQSKEQKIKNIILHMISAKAVVSVQKNVLKKQSKWYQKEVRNNG